MSSTENKTAMVQLKEKLQVVVDSLEDAVHGTDQYGYRGAMENVIKDIDAQMLGIEKQQIMKAVNDTFESTLTCPEGKMDTPIDGIDYYNHFYPNL